MPRKILIVGAGQSGLQLALGLQKHGYDVTVMSSRTPEEIRTGRIMSTQAMFGPALAHERDLGLDFWHKDAPDIDSIQVTVAPQGEGLEGLAWTGRLSAPCQSVDQRVKMSRWLLEFARHAAREKNGKRTGRGRVIIGGATGSDLEHMTRIGLFDLIIIASGRGELGRMFKPDPDHSPYKQPQRHLSVTYVHGARRSHEPGGANTVNINLLPGVVRDGKELAGGELFIIPALTTTGPCHIVFFEAIPGGVLDQFTYRTKTGEEHLQLVKDLMREHAPWEYQRFQDATLTDWGGFLTGEVTPAVRHPAGYPKNRNGQVSGPVLGMADAVMTNDPITGQGSNNAAHCAAVYLQAILDHGGKPFDEEWMQRTWDIFWNTTGQAVTTWTNAMLQPPPPHVSRLLSAAQVHKEVADRFVGIFERPRTAHDWFLDPGKAHAYLAQTQAQRM